jgi:succinate dehydrogenase / fumarate reductase flavoprotein subunit
VDRVVETDVLAVGGSGAGSTAAVAAARGGARVILVSKGALGRSGNSILAGASLAMDGESAAAYGEKGADKSFTKDVSFTEIVKQSYYLADQNLVQHFVDYAPERVHEIVEWGKQVGQPFVFFPPSGWVTSGRCIGSALRYGVKQTAGIEVIEDVMVTDILTKDGRVAGALGVDVYTGELIAFRARSVVLGTGGYQPFSFKCTVSDMTGDGMAMAYRAGATLADMEFLLFIPGVVLAPYKHKGNILPFLWLTVGFAFPDVKNGIGESIVAKMPPEMLSMARGSEWCKLIYMYYWGKDIAEGKGTANGGVLLDFSKLPKQEIWDAANRTWPLFKTWYGEEWRYLGEDFSDFKEMLEKDIPLEVGLSNEYSNGGIMVDSGMATGVPGLFAGGEVATGVFGAMRVADALVEMLVEGYKAGESAADYVRHAPGAELDADQIDSIKARLTRPFAGGAGISPSRLHAAIEKTADAGFGVWRDEAGLTAALKELERIRQEEVPAMRVKNASRAYNYDWIEAIQVDNLLTCTEAGIRAAIMRKESRGTHIRRDYPVVDHDNWLVRILARNEGGRMVLATRKPVVTRLALPAGKHPDVMAYALDCESKFKNAELWKD